MPFFSWSLHLLFLSFYPLSLPILLPPNLSRSFSSLSPPSFLPLATSMRIMIFLSEKLDLKWIIWQGYIVFEVVSQIL